MDSNPSEMRIDIVSKTYCSQLKKYTVGKKKKL